MAAGVALVIAFVTGLARTSRWLVIRFVTGVYVEIFRGTSGLVQIYVFFYVLPFYGLPLGPVETGVLALGLNFGAYGSEVVRAAIRNVDRAQREAAIALNMPNGLMMRRIILPQAIVAMLPPFGNMLIELLKATSLVSVITLAELTFAGRIVGGTTGRRQEVMVLVLLMYFVMAFPLTRIMRRLESRTTKGLQVGRPT
jgi:polar amino acid transport system permease protein